MLAVARVFVGNIHRRYPGPDRCPRIELHDPVQRVLRCLLVARVQLRGLLQFRDCAVTIPEAWRPLVWADFRFLEASRNRVVELTPEDDSGDGIFECCIGLDRKPMQTASHDEVAAAAEIG